jgi:hypothetical protein
VPWRGLWEQVVPIQKPWCSICQGGRGRLGVNLRLMDARGVDPPAALRICSACLDLDAEVLARRIGGLLRLKP